MLFQGFFKVDVCTFQQLGSRVLIEIDGTSLKSYKLFLNPIIRSNYYSKAFESVIELGKISMLNADSFQRVPSCQYSAGKSLHFVSTKCTEYYVKYKEVISCKNTGCGKLQNRVGSRRFGNCLFFHRQWLMLKMTAPHRPPFPNTVIRRHIQLIAWECPTAFYHRVSLYTTNTIRPHMTKL